MYGAKFSDASQQTLLHRPLDVGAAEAGRMLCKERPARVSRFQRMRGRVLVFLRELDPLSGQRTVPDRLALRVARQWHVHMALEPPKHRRIQLPCAREQEFKQRPRTWTVRGSDDHDAAFGSAERQARCRRVSGGRTADVPSSSRKNSFLIRRLVSSSPSLRRRHSESISSKKRTQPPVFFFACANKFLMLLEQVNERIQPSRTSRFDPASS